jgi:acylaminoacyl-peptidase
MAMAMPSFAQTVKPVLKPLDVFDLQWVADPQISPDGRNIAYVRMRFDIKTDRPRGSVWLVGSDGKHARPLTSAPSSSSPRWSPDGSRIAYVARDNDGSSQLFMYWLESGAGASISNFTESPNALSWSPDGQWLAFTMAAPAEHKSLKVDLPEAPKGSHWADPPRLIDRMVYRADGEGYLPNTFSQLYLVSADGGAARQLTHGDFDADGPPAFTPDGKGILFSSNRRADADYEPADGEIYRVDLTDDSLHALTDRRGPDLRPTPSPDGKHIAYIGFDDKHLGYQAQQLYVMDSDGTHSHSLTTGLDRDARSPQWSADGKEIYFQYEDHGNGNIAVVDLAAKIRPIRLLACGASGAAGAGHRHFAEGRGHLPLAQRYAADATHLGQGGGDLFRIFCRQAPHPGLDHSAPGIRSSQEISAVVGDSRRTVCHVRAELRRRNAAVRLGRLRGAVS